MSESEGVAEFRRLLESREAADGNANAVYAALRETGRLSKQRLIAYRCLTRGCLLLDVVSVPGQVVIHQPRYRTSPNRTAATSNESGRAKNTEDGERRWKARTFDHGSAINFTLSCDHLHHVVIPRGRVQRDLDEGLRLVKITGADHETPATLGAQWLD